MKQRIVFAASLIFGIIAACTPFAIITEAQQALPTSSAGSPPPGAAGNVNSYNACVYPGATATPNVTAGNAIAQQCDANGNMKVIVQGGAGSPIPYATAGSPAPGNLLGCGFNSTGVACPIICHNYATVTIAATTQTTETVVVPSAAGKIIYICSVLMTSGGGTQTGVYGLTTSATNTCGSMSNLMIANPSSGGGFSLGTGTGVIAQTAAGVALCFENGSASAAGAYNLNIMYEQFLRSLTLEQLDAFCSVPKRCLLYGLVKHLNRLIDNVENPIP